MQTFSVQIQDSYIEQFMNFVNENQTNQFEINFNIIFEYIAKDKFSAAKTFKNELFKQIKFSL
jgi:hypothetical protein